MEVLPLNAHSTSHISSVKLRHSWRPPPMNQLKCNVDAAFSDTKNVAAVAAVIRDREGELIGGKAHKIPCPSSRVAEALALREGLILLILAFAPLS